MQRNFILTDVMKTGLHTEIEHFISMHSFTDQQFDITGEYYTLHNYDLDSYHRKFAVIDVRHHNDRIKDNKDFHADLKRRCDLLHSQGFVFIKATPWESVEYVNYPWPSDYDLHPQIDIPHIKWTGDVSWFWFLMFTKHKANQFNLKHDHTSKWQKPYDFLFLNKTPRVHRTTLYEELFKKHILDNSIHTFVGMDPPRRLDKKYELPGIDPEDYPPMGKDQDLYELPYLDTVCSLVSETNANNYDVFMTEKIWKAVLTQHVFVVHGNYLYLQKLREMGFKTFGGYFDESYDLEKDSNTRINKIVELCSQLKEWCDGSKQKWQDLYLQTQSIRQHNYDTFFDQQKLSLQINKTLELFLEFADSSQVSS